MNVLPEQSSGVDSSLLKFMLDTKETLDRLEMFLRGVQREVIEKENEKGEKELILVETKKKPLLSEKGIEFIMTTLRSIATKDVFVSNFSQKETYANIRSLSLSILKELWIHYEIGDWDIKDLSTLREIYNMCYMFVFASLKRPYNEGERRFMRPVLREDWNPTEKKGPSILG